MIRPKITIVTSNFNSGNDILITIDSIRKLKYKPIEWIVIDGGSTDGSIKLLYDNIDVVSKIVSEHDDGIYDAWNKGVKLASGDYISFLGAGDFYIDGGLEMLVNAAERCPEKQFISSRIELYEKDVGKSTRTVGRRWNWLIFRRYNNIAHPGALHSKRLFCEVGYFDKSFAVAGDYELLLRLKNKLDTDFVDRVTARMLRGGVSSKGIIGFQEAHAARIKNHSLPEFLSILEYYIARIKFNLKRLLGAFI